MSGLWEGYSNSLIAACFIQSKSFDACLRSLSCWNAQLCPSFNCLPVNLKNLEIVLLNYSLHFVHCANTADRKTVPEHNDTTTTVLNSWYNVLRLERFMCSH